jgi:hypothetical protein
MIQNPSSMLDAQRRFLRALRIFFIVACLVSFGQSLHAFWPEGIPRALAMSALITSIVAVLLGLTFRIGKTMGLRHIELTWKERRDTEQDSAQLFSNPREHGSEKA